MPIMDQAATIVPDSSVIAPTVWDVKRDLDAIDNTFSTDGNDEVPHLPLP